MEALASKNNNFKEYVNYQKLLQAKKDLKETNRLIDSLENLQKTLTKDKRLININTKHLEKNIARRENLKELIEVYRAEDIALKIDKDIYLRKTVPIVLGSLLATIKSVPTYASSLSFDNFSPIQTVPIIDFEFIQGMCVLITIAFYITKLLKILLGKLDEGRNTEEKDNKRVIGIVRSTVKYGLCVATIYALPMALNFSPMPIIP